MLASSNPSLAGAPPPQLASPPRQCGNAELTGATNAMARTIAALTVDGEFAPILKPGQITVLNKERTDEREALCCPLTCLALPVLKMWAIGLLETPFFPNCAHVHAHRE